MIRRIGGRVTLEPHECVLRKQALRLGARLLAEALRAEEHLGRVDLNEANGRAALQHHRVTVGDVPDPLVSGRRRRQARAAGDVTTRTRARRAASRISPTVATRRAAR